MCKGHRADDGRRRVACNAGQFVQSNTGLFCDMRIYVLHGLDPFLGIDSVRWSDRVVRQVASSLFDFCFRRSPPAIQLPTPCNAKATLALHLVKYKTSHSKRIITDGLDPSEQGSARGVNGRRQLLS